MDIVRFKGGLGNQMFQYALLKALAAQGREVKVSLGFYDRHPDMRRFCLTDVFKNISIDIVEENIFEQIDEQWKKIKNNKGMLERFLIDYPNRFFWVEDPEGVYEDHIFQTNNCTFVGYWQAEKYPAQIREGLLQDFQFSKGEELLSSLKKKLLANDNYVSVHVRRGDYLETPQLFGNICTEQYYETAMHYIREKVESPMFLFFSDDIQWVKEHFKLSNAIYIEPDMFEDYKYWYDMCLMSCCAHNIIANSSFSWWGAWLNKRAAKIVIAPKCWFNGREMTDICPSDWIRL